MFIEAATIVSIAHSSVTPCSRATSSNLEEEFFYIGYAHS